MVDCVLSARSPDLDYAGPTGEGVVPTGTCWRLADRDRDVDGMRPPCSAERLLRPSHERHSRSSCLANRGSLTGPRRRGHTKNASHPAREPSIGRRRRRQYRDNCTSRRTYPVEVEQTNRVHVNVGDFDWFADPLEIRLRPEDAAASGVESVEVDGSSLTGTASFVGRDITTQEWVTMTGTFEATCGA